MHAIDADEQNVLGFVALQFIVSRTSWERSAEQGKAQRNRSNTFFQDNSPFFLRRKERHDLGGAPTRSSTIGGNCYGQENGR
jgi:hypothetical protein